LHLIEKEKLQSPTVVPNRRKSAARGRRLILGIDSTKFNAQKVGGFFALALGGAHAQAFADKRLRKFLRGFSPAAI
jgi:hypothetical protein